jgi:CelD/BcsL family acetyltransferase involved in cellulose biosynthesis
MTRRLADLRQGLEAFLARRSPRFRRNLRQAERRWQTAGLDVELVYGGGAEVIDRCVAIEHRSWKGSEESGLTDAKFAAFYRALAERLEGERRLRVGFARHQGCDVGFILGAVREGRYRGLQLSYDQRFASCSVGNVLQLRQMAALVDEGVVDYDLGMDMAYKQSWADRALTTRTLVVVRG